MRNAVEFLNHLYAIRDAYPANSSEHACYQRAINLALEYGNPIANKRALDSITDKDKKAMYLVVNQAEGKLENATGLKLPPDTMLLLNRLWLAMGDLKRNLCQHT